MAGRGSRGLAVLLWGALALGCGGEAVPLDWRIEVADALATDTAVVTAEIFEETCAAGDAIFADAVRRTETASLPRELAEGTYCFAARGIGADCVPTTQRVTATVKLPQPAGTLVLLDLDVASVDTASVCVAPAVCDDGLCRGPGATGDTPDP